MALGSKSFELATVGIIFRWIDTFEIQKVLDDPSLVFLYPLRGSAAHGIIFLKSLGDENAVSFKTTERLAGR